MEDLLFWTPAGQAQTSLNSIKFLLKNTILGSSWLAPDFIDFQLNRNQFGAPPGQAYLFYLEGNFPTNIPVRSTFQLRKAPDEQI